MSPKISFVMPTHNRLEWLGEAIQSTLSQTEKDIELVIVDDASTDGTKDFLDDWASKFPNVKVIHNEKQMGGGRSRNIGMEAASAPLIAVCDDDDISPNERAAITLKYFEEHPECELVNFPYLSIGYFNQIVNEFLGEPFNHESFLKDGVVNYFCNPSCAYKKTSAQEVGGYGEENEHQTDDIQFIKKWVEAGKKIHFQGDFFLNNHRVLPSSMMSKQRGWEPAWAGEKA